MIGRVFGWFLTIVVLCGFIAYFAGSAVMHQVANNGGAATGQGLSGGFTFVGAMGRGFDEANAVDAQIKAADAAKRADAAEKRADAAEKKAQGR